MDTLTDGLSCLTPVSPIASVPPTFPHLEPPELLEPPTLPSLLLPPTPISSSAAAHQVHHSDHAYQAGEATGGGWGQISGHSAEEQSADFSSSQSCLAPVRLEPQPTEAQACISALPAKLGANLRCVWVGGLGMCLMGRVPASNTPFLLLVPQETPW